MRYTTRPTRADINDARARLAAVVRRYKGADPVHVREAVATTVAIELGVAIMWLAPYDEVEARLAAQARALYEEWRKQSW